MRKRVKRRRIDRPNNVVAFPTPVKPKADEIALYSKNPPKLRRLRGAAIPAGISHDPSLAVIELAPQGSTPFLMIFKR